MKYSAFFLLMGGAGVYWALHLEAVTLQLLTGWFAVSSFLFSIAYALNTPGLICGKQSTPLLKICALISIPWLLITWIIWSLQALLSREDACNQIESTEIWIGRRPLSYRHLSSYNYIIDLTAEFPSLATHGEAKVIHTPNLDGIPLASIGIPEFINKEDKIFIHCAQGHGRSSSYAALLLMKLEYCADITKALELIQTSRPGRGHQNHSARICSVSAD